MCSDSRNRLFAASRTTVIVGLENQENYMTKRRQYMPWMRKSNKINDVNLESALLLVDGEAALLRSHTCQCWCLPVSIAATHINMSLILEILKVNWILGIIIRKKMYLFDIFIVSLFYFTSISTSSTDSTRASNLGLDWKVHFSNWDKKMVRRSLISHNLYDQILIVDVCVYNNLAPLMWVAPSVVQGENTVTILYFRWCYTGNTLECNSRYLEEGLLENLIRIDRRRQFDYRMYATSWSW